MDYLVLNISYRLQQLMEGYIYMDLGQYTSSDPLVTKHKQNLYFGRLIRNSVTS